MVNLSLQKFVCYDNLNELEKKLDYFKDRVKIEIRVNKLSSQVILIIQDEFIFILNEVNYIGNYFLYLKVESNELYFSGIECEDEE